MTAPIRPAFFETAKALFSLSQTQRRLAHEIRREAFKWEAAGNYQNFASCMLEGRRLKDAETAIEEYSCRTLVSRIASEMETLAARLRAYRLSEKRRQISDAQKYLDALESIDAVGIDCGHFESAARTMQEIARKAIAEVQS